MTEVISYAYAIARDTDGSLAEALSGLPGVAEAPVHLVRAGDRGAVVVAVSPVPEQDFQEAALRANLEDLEWLESVARAHHRVIEALASRTTVLPLRLATVYLDDERVCEMLITRKAAFAERLAVLAAHTEWGVKIYVEAPAPTDRPSRAARGRRSEPRTGLPQPPQGTAARPGGRLPRRRRGRPARRDRRPRPCGRPGPAPGAAGRTRPWAGENVVNDAYLVPLRHAESFRADVSRAAEGLSGVRVEVTGPWAPYSFATPPETEPVTGAAP